MMEKQYKKLIDISVYFFWVSVIALSCAALLKYPGNKFIYLIFTIVLNGLLWCGFRRDRIFFDTFIGIFFWLGYWLKFSVRMAFMDGKFIESVGQYFDYSGPSYDHALSVACCGAAALIFVSLIRSRFFFKYRNMGHNRRLDGIFALYKKIRMPVLIAFVLIFTLVALSNIYFGIYQRGTIPKTILPFAFSGVYKWLLLFGLASISALILEFELLLKREASISIAALCMLESFCTNVSMLSRGMVINVFAIATGFVNSFKRKKIRFNFKFLICVLTIFTLLFGSSIVVVSLARTYNFLGIIDTDFSKMYERTYNTTKILILDRWVGIEGVIAVSSYPNLGWELWSEAWHEQYRNYGTSLYDREIANSFYLESELNNYHFISLPGILAFLYYPGSYAFLFLSMGLVGAAAALIERFVHTLCYGNFILIALFSQVIAYRFAHFGYAPGRSYMLFGAIALNVFIIYFANKYLSYQKRLSTTSKMKIQIDS